jgi:hypothetical protein
MRSGYEPGWTELVQLILMAIILFVLIRVLNG